MTYGAWLETRYLLCPAAVDDQNDGSNSNDTQTNANDYGVRSLSVAVVGVIFGIYNTNE